MQTVINRNGDRISLMNKIGGGGEGYVWETNLEGYVAKIYNTPDAKKEKKLEIMVANPPVDPTASSHNHTSIAWPTDLLKDEHQKFVGFLMPKIQDSRIITFVYNPKLRKENCPNFNWQYLHATAKNIAWIVQNIHEKGYILGDVKSENLLVNNKSLVTVVDTDSFQVYDYRNDQYYHCPVSSVGLTPPELLDINVNNIVQSKAHDHFRLAIIIYYLLSSGQHPFDGDWRGKGDNPGQDDCIREGYWLYRPNSLIQPSHRTIPLELFHPRIQACFHRCFNDGHSKENSHLRPSAKEWNDALEVAIQDLITCTQLSNHVYSKTYGLSYSRCYWCDRAKNLGSDIFATESVLPKASLSSAKTKAKFPVGFLIAIAIAIAIVILIIIFIIAINY